MKLRNKLILSCAALAAVATTAVSTTFAWYTANDTVKATGITGKTSDQDATLLLISDSGKQGHWGASVSIPTSGVTLEPVTYMHADKYVPATGYAAAKKFYTKSGNTYTEATVDDAEAYAAGEFYEKKEAGKYYTWDAGNNQEGAEATGAKGTAAASGYISFYLYFKSGSASSLNVQVKAFELVNTTAATQLPTNTVLADGTGSSTNSYSINMFRATNVVLTTQNAKEVAGDSTTDAQFDTSDNAATIKRTPYSADALVAAKSDSYVAEQAGQTAGTYTGSNAHRYYNNVKSLTGNDAISTTTVTSEEYEADDNNGAYGSVSDLQTGSFSLGTTGAGATGALDNILIVKFDIYLDGWDVACFDACRKQQFTLNMEFASPASTNNG